MKAPFALVVLKYGGAVVIDTCRIAWVEISDEAASLLQGDSPGDLTQEEREFLDEASRLGWLERTSK